ncbi:MAG: LysM peptidoglycan-binding domain-containing protein [Epsilonproteobacteria bacterium]|nr:LysM peptidoglycan-binding domain-containing protein [Campylobacterota bacterium]
MKVFLMFFSLVSFITLTFSVSFSETKAVETRYYYKVNKNDTMWDISKRYYKDSRKWPVLYSRNRKVYNPNLIFPGEYLLIDKKITIKNIQENGKKNTKHADYFSVKRAEFILRKRIAGTASAEENFKLSGQILTLKPYKKLKTGEIITLIRKIPEKIGNLAIADPVGYAKVINNRKAVVTELFEEIGDNTYFIEGSRKQVLLNKKPIGIKKISLFGRRHLSIFTGATLWGQINGDKNRMGSSAVLWAKNGGHKILSGIVTSQEGNIIGITVTELFREYEPHVFMKTD